MYQILKLSDESFPTLLNLLGHFLQLRDFSDLWCPSGTVRIRISRSPLLKRWSRVTLYLVGFFTILGPPYVVQGLLYWVSSFPPLFFLDSEKESQETSEN